MKQLTYIFILALFGVAVRSSTVLGQSVKKSSEEFNTASETKGKISNAANDTNRVVGNIQSGSVNIQSAAVGSYGQIPLGYGFSSTKNELTAAAGIVRANKLSKRSLSENAGNALYGLLPGLMVLENGSFSPTPTQTNFFVRGVNTTSAKNPLILVDGFEEPFQSYTEVAGLSVDEIESITVLKDAAALAKYGQRGANGVILITTKRGKKGDLTISGSYEQGITTPKNVPSFVNGPTYARAINEALVNDGIDPRYSQADLSAFNSGNSPYLYPNVNWADQVLRNSGMRNNFNISVNGGGNSVRYFLMGNAVGSNGFFGPVSQNDDYSTQVKYRRFNFRSNIDVDITDKLLFKTNISGSIVERNIPGGGGGTQSILNSIYSVPSAAYPVYTPDGSLGGAQDFALNPVGILTSTGYGQPNNRKFSVAVQLHRDMGDVVEGLSAEGSLRYFASGTFFEQNSKSFSYIDISPVRDSAGNLIDTTTTRYGNSTPLEFIDSFGNELKYADEVAKFNYQRDWESVDLDASMLFHQSSQIFNGQDNVYHRRNFVGNVHAGIDEKYFIGLTGSYSGNNIMEPGDRYGFFPAVSAGWMISNEPFMEGVDNVNRLKLRGSWGLTGSDNVPSNHLYKQTYNGAAGYWFERFRGFYGGFAEGAYPTQDFTFETSEKINLGLEATLFGKLDFTGDIFYDQRTDILVGTGGRYSDVLGVASGQETDGVVENKGIEASLTWRDNIGSDFSYNIGGNLLYTQNEIVNNNEQYRPYDYLKRTGRQVGQNFGLQAIGFFENQQDIDSSPEQVFSEVEPGDIKYKDQNGDGIINNFDEIPLGHSNGYPEIYYSVSFGFDYKGLGASALVQGTANYTAYTNARNIFWPLYGNQNISEYYYNNRWTPETANSAILPRLTSQSNDNNFRPNSLWLTDRSFVKLRIAEVYYSFPASVTEDLRMSNLKLYVRGYNLLTFSDVPVMDPEGVNGGYPFMRTFSVGLNMKF